MRVDVAGLGWDAFTSLPVCAYAVSRHNHVQGALLLGVPDKYVFFSIKEWYDRLNYQFPNLVIYKSG